MCKNGYTLSDIRKKGIVLALEGGRTPGRLANAALEESPELASQVARFAAWCVKNPELAHKYIDPPTSESPEVRITSTMRVIRRLESQIGQCERALVWMEGNDKDPETAQQRLRKLKRSLSGHKGQRTKLKNAIAAA